MLLFSLPNVNWHKVSLQMQPQFNDSYEKLGNLAHARTVYGIPRRDIAVNGIQKGYCGIWHTKKGIAVYGIPKRVLRYMAYQKGYCGIWHTKKGIVVYGI